MATLGTAYVQIVPTAKGIKGSISNALGGEAEAAGTDAGTKIGGFAKKALAKAAIAGAVIATVKGALDEGAKLQQSYLGGVDTLYGAAAENVRAYAREAAQAGISMNTYSEQAVSFGAALKKAYGGDVTKAAEAANTAIMDMADNSAKMGTDITSVQMAYQGFAKQNYTMLDNLKLGYGGTKTEMERLLADAEKLTGVEYNIDNLGDVYSAIHAIQGELGLTGVAAAEATTTLSGSFGAMKAAWQNLLGSLALGQNIAPAMSQLMTSVSTLFFNNFLPMIGTLIKSLPGAIFTFLQVGLPLLVANVSNLLNTLGTQITSFANGVSSTQIKTWAQKQLPKILEAGGKLILTLAKAFINNLPKIVVAIGKIGAAIVKGLGSAIWEKVKAAATTVKDKFLEPIKTMKEKVKAIIDKIADFFPLKLGKILSFSLPSISIGTKSTTVGDKTVKVPTFSLSWASHALGGIISRRMLMASGGTVHEFGEAGPEAIVPLNPFWKRLEQMQASNSTNVVININGANKDPREIAAEVKRELIRETNQRRLAWQ